MLTELFIQTAPKISNDGKIERIAPISTIFGPIELRRRDLLPIEGKERKVFKKFFAVVAGIVVLVVGDFRGDTNRIPSLV